MKREDLRNVVITSNDYLKARAKDTGYFHQWITIGDQVDGYGTFGIIELESGECIRASIGDFKFIDYVNNG